MTAANGAYCLKWKVKSNVFVRNILSICPAGLLLTLIFWVLEIFNFMRGLWIPPHKS